MSLTTIIFFAGLISVGFVIIRWFKLARRYQHYVNCYPNQAYDFFIVDNERWAVFEVASTELKTDQIENACGMPQRELLGPLQFRVPKRHNRLVTVYGKSKDCFEFLDQFVLRMKCCGSN